MKEIRHVCDNLWHCTHNVLAEQSGKKTYEPDPKPVKKPKKGKK